MRIVGRLIALAGCLALLGTGTATAQNRSPFPPFTGDRLYVQGVPNLYEPLRGQIEQIELSSPQTYYVVVIPSSGRGQWATRDYIDEMYQAWVGEAQSKDLSLDPDRSVIVVLAVENRQLSVHAGTVLQQRYGLRGQTIDREIVQPHFIPHAKAGNYAQGLSALLQAIEDWVQAKEKAEQKREQEAAARRAQIKRDAETTLADATQLHGAVRQALAEKKQTGLVTVPLESDVDEAGDRLSAARGLLETDPPAALREAQQAQQSLQRTSIRLRQLAAVQAEADAQLNRADALAGQVDAALEQSSRAGLAVGPLETQVGEVREQLAVARRRVRTDPEAALAQSRQLAEQLQAIKTAALKLPELRRQVHDSAAASAELRQAVVQDLDRARRAGVRVAPIQTRLEELGQRLQAAEALGREDYPAALEAYAAVHSELADTRAALASRYRHHRFLTRTLPAAFFAALLFVVALVLAWKRRKHLRFKRTLNAEFTDFRERVMQLRQRLEAIKAQHETLPVTDKDFQQPMAGQTLALYSQVQDDIAALWDEWLRRMDVWEQVQRLVGAEKPFSTVKLLQAQRVLDEAESFEDAERCCQSCVERLQRLEQAHERAGEALEKVDQLTAKLHEQMDALRAAHLATTPYEAQGQQCARSVDQGRALLPADPLAAFDTLVQAQEKIIALGRWTEQILNHCRSAQQVQAELAKMTDLVAETRAAGTLLTEPEGNPDALVAHAQSQHAAALLALDRGEAEPAVELLNHAAQLAQQSEQLVQRVLAAKQFCAEQIAERRARTEQLLRLLHQAGQQHDELQREFAADSWAGIAENLPRAHEFLATFDPLVQQAESNAAPQTQHYLRAAGILERVQQKQDETEQLADAVRTRLAELVEMRRRCQTQRSELDTRADELAAFVAEHDRIVGKEAREWSGTAQDVLRDLDLQMAQPRPHWPIVETSLSETAAKLAEALSHAENDVRTWQQLNQQTETVRQAAGRVESFLHANTRDRPRANHRLRAAQEVLDQVAREIQVPQNDWSRLLSQVEHAAHDLQQAEALAKEDIRLAQQAEAEIEQARRELLRAKHYSRLGVSADVTASENQLSEAQARLQALAYERAIELAHSAEHAARNAYEEAVRQARAKQRELERQRQLQQAASNAQWNWMAGSSGSNWAQGSTNASWSGGSSITTWSGGGGSSSSSWSSGSSQSSW